MKRVLSVLFLIIFGIANLYSQDSTEIRFTPETPGDYTKFKFSFEHKNRLSVKQVRLEIITDGITFSNPSTSGEANTRAWRSLLDTATRQSLIFFGETPFYYGEEAGVFHFELNGDDAMVSIVWSTLDSLNGTLKKDTTRIAHAVSENCWAIAFNNRYHEDIDISSGTFLSPTTNSGNTWEMWFYLSPYTTLPTDFGYSQMLASFSDVTTPTTPGNSVYLGFGHGGYRKNHLVFSVGNTLTQTVGVDMTSIRGWIHVAGVWDPRPGHKKISIYVHPASGSVPLLTATKLITTLSTPSPIPSGIKLGNWQGNDGPSAISDYFFDGKMDEIRFWDKARTSHDIVSTMHECNLTDNNLYSYYPVLIDEIYSPDFGTILHDFTSTNNSTSTTHINWTPDNAPLECCQDSSEPCLCADEYGNPNYEIISVINLNDPDNCCWRIELDVKCDMLFVNRLWFQFPAVSPLTPISAPGGWSVFPSGMGGYLVEFPDSYLPQGVHTFKMCFPSPSNPTQFPVVVHLLDYYSDKDYNEPCDPVRATIECDSSCTCEGVTVEDPIKYKTDDPDLQCCFDLTIHSECDKNNIKTLEFSYLNGPVGTSVSSSPQQWTFSNSSNNNSRFTNNEGYLKAGDHNFKICLGRSVPGKATQAILQYLDANNKIVCPPDTFDLACDCCEKFFLETHYRIWECKLLEWWRSMYEFTS